MALTQKKHLGIGGIGMQGDGPGSVASMIKELQGFSVSVVAGAAADTNIAVTGIALEDTIASVVKFTAGVPSDVTGVAAITSAGNIQLTATSAGDVLQVFWFNKQ